MGAGPYAGAGGGEAGSNGTEVDVEAEEREVLSMACAMGVGRQDVEQALLDSAGNWELVLQVLPHHVPRAPGVWKHRQVSVPSSRCWWRERLTWE